MSDASMYYKDLYQCFPDPLLVMEINGTVVDCNSAALDALCATRDEIVGKTPLEFSPVLQPDGTPSKSLFFDYYDCFIAEGLLRGEWLFESFAGQPFLVAFTAWRLSMNKDHALVSWRLIDANFRVDALVAKLQPSERDQVNAKLRYMLDQSTLFAGIAGADNAAEFISQGGRKLVGLPADESYTFLTIQDLLAQQDRAWHTEHILPALMASDYWIGEMLLNSSEGTAIPVMGEIFVLPHEPGQPQQLGYLMSDIRPQQSRELTLRKTLFDMNQANTQFENVLEMIGEGVWYWNVATGEVSHNHSWWSLFGEEPNPAASNFQGFKEKIHPEDLERVIAAINNTLDEDAPYEISYRMIRRDGIVIWVKDKGNVTARSESGQPLRMIGAIKDISHQVVADKKIQDLIFFDQLTQLPNRKYIKDRIERTLNEASRHRAHSGLMYMDLNDFKIVNDTYGHGVGDELLKAFGERVQKAIRPLDVLARLGGDEFLVLFEKLNQSEEAAIHALKLAANRIINYLQAPFVINNAISIQVRVSIGVVVFGQESDSYDEILTRADLAMYDAKQNPESTYRVFDKKLKEDFQRYQALGVAMKEGIEREQFFAVYQPVVNRDQQCVAYEALARWQSTALDLVMPNEFISFAEKSGYLIDVGWKIIKNILSNPQIQADLNFDIMVNISALQLMDVGFPEKLIQMCDLYQISYQRIHVEVTESVLVSNFDIAISAMRRLIDKGMCFVIDDFGTGFSSLAYLQKLPIKFLKIDQSFVRGLGQSQGDEKIVLNVLSLAESLGLEVVAEGVETQAQFEFLHAHGCHYFQGWYFGKPSINLKYHNN